MKHAAAAMVSAILACAAMPAAASDEDAERTFRLCDSEGFMALNMGRNYMLGKRDKANVLPYLRADDEFAQDMAKELFRRVDAGEIRHYADFAAEKLHACSRREKMELTQPAEKTRLCYARADVPFFVGSDKEDGLSKSRAVAQTAKRLVDRALYPERLISVAADMLYDDPPMDMRKAMGMVFWSCMNAED